LSCFAFELLDDDVVAADRRLDVVDTDKEGIIVAGWFD
jgi:hypothetical protein